MSTPGLGPVVIGPREIYDAVTRPAEQVARLVDQHDSTRVEVADHETRIRKLEGNRWPLPTVTVLVSIGSLVIAAVALISR